MVTRIEAGPWNTIYGPLVTISMVYCRNQSYDNAPQAFSVKFIILQEYIMIESACLMHFQHLEGRSEASFWAMKESVSSMGESTSSANFFGKKKKKLQAPISRRHRLFLDSSPGSTPRNSWVDEGTNLMSCMKRLITQLSYISWTETLHLLAFGSSGRSTSIQSVSIPSAATPSGSFFGIPSSDESLTSFENGTCVSSSQSRREILP